MKLIANLINNDANIKPYSTKACFVRAYPLSCSPTPWWQSVGGATTTKPKKLHNWLVHQSVFSMLCSRLIDEYVDLANTMQSNLQLVLFTTLAIQNKDVVWKVAGIQFIKGHCWMVRRKNM